MHEAHPSRTALRVALRRAAHQVHDAHPLVFEDPLAIRILGREHAAEVARTPDKLRRPFSAALRAFMVARARLAEDALAAAYARGVRQYLILGAGLDTFAYRNPHAGLHVFEIDHPNTQAWKHDLLAAAHIPIPASTTHVAVDFEHQTLAHQLRAAHFDFSASAVVAWLGVVPYLTREAFRSTLQLIGSFAPGTELLFDYSLPRAALPAVEQLMLDSMSARVRQAGEPFQLFFTPAELRDELDSAHLRVLEDLDSSAINALLFAERTDGLHLRGTAGRICNASVKTEPLPLTQPCGDLP